MVVRFLTPYGQLDVEDGLGDLVSSTVDQMRSSDREAFFKHSMQFGVVDALGTISKEFDTPLAQHLYGQSFLSTSDDDEEDDDLVPVEFDNDDTDIDEDLPNADFFDEYGLDAEDYA